MSVKWTRYRSTGVPAELCRTPVADGWASSRTVTRASPHTGYCAESVEVFTTEKVKPTSGTRALVAMPAVARNFPGTAFRLAFTSRSQIVSAPDTRQVLGACRP